MESLAGLARAIERLACGTRGVEPLPGVHLGAASQPGLPIHGVYRPLFVLVAQGTKRVTLADRVFDNRAGDYLVLPLDLPATSVIVEASEAEPYLGAVMSIEPELVASLVLEAGPPPRHDGELRAIGVRTAPAELVDAFLRLLRLAERPADVPILKPMIEREIVWRLLCGEMGGLVRQIGLSDSRLSKIGLATRWLREHYAETARVEELAERVAMSPTSFYRHFRAATGMSPLQYQKQIRLQEARSLLMAKSDDIAHIGFRVGYDSPSQFSREYARQFGSPPSRDGLVLREALAP